MHVTWNLDELFCNSESFYKEINKIECLLLDINTYKNQDLDEETLLTLLDKKWDLKERINNILVYGSLRYYQNINSEECINLKKDAEKLNNEINCELTFIDRKILELGKEKVEDFINKNQSLQTYRLAIDNLFRMEEHVTSTEVTRKTKENLDSINQKITEYNNLLRDIKYGSIKIDEKEIEITSSNFAKYLASRDREIRKQTYLITNQSFKNHQNEFSTILDSIFGYRLKNTELENYNSVLEKALFEENIDSNVVGSLITTVNDNLTLIHKYLGLKSKLLGIPDPHLYDFGVPIDHNLKIKYTLEEAIEIIKKALEPLGKTYLEIVDKLLDGHIDAELNEDKHQSITFSWNTYSFMNFRGSYIDLKNLIHELGHIVNYYLSKNNVPFIYADSTVFVGEISSTINEILLNRYLTENAKTEEEKLFYLTKEIENYFNYVFKQTMYTELENYLYDAKQEYDLKPELISLKYDELIHKYFGKDILYDEVSKIEWTRLGHLYRWSYYPYKYATGLIIANAVVNSLFDEKTLPIEQYLEFLSLGSSVYSLELLKKINIDFKDSTLIQNGFRVLERDLKKLEDIIKFRKR